jgi:hypothetical protein
MLLRIEPTSLLSNIPTSYRDIIITTKITNLRIQTSQNPIQIEPPSTPTYQYISESTSSYIIRSSPSINTKINIDNSSKLLIISIFNLNLNISSLNKIFSSDPLNTIINTITRSNKNTYYLSKQTNPFISLKPNKTICFSIIKPITSDLASTKILQIYNLLIEVYLTTKSYNK